MTQREWEELLNGVIVGAVLLGIVALTAICSPKKHSSQYEYLVDKLGEEGKEMLDKQFEKAMNKKKKEEEQKTQARRSDLVKKMQKEEQAKKEKIQNLQSKRSAEVFKEDIQEKKLR